MVSQTPNTMRTYELRHIYSNDMCRICMLSSEYLKNSSHELTPKICKMLNASTQINVSFSCVSFNIRKITGLLTILPFRFQLTMVYRNLSATFVINS